MAKKVAILGGGPAGLAAALGLTDPVRAGQFDVTVYLQGGRLGGKCASSRNPAVGERNEEHGLHVWFGCYENAFGTLDRVYREHPEPPFPTIWDAFFPRPYTVLGKGSTNDPDRWDVVFPSMPGKPGDGTPIREPSEVVGFAMQTLHDLILELIRNARAAHPNPAMAILLFDAEIYFRAEMAVLKTLQVARIGDFLLSQVNSGGATLLDAMADRFAGLIEMVAGGIPGVSKAVAAIDILLAALRGLLDPRDRALADQDLDVLDQYEFGDWLRDHGCRQQSLDSAFIRAVYECMFEYTDGDRRRPSYAAGVAVRAVLRIGMTFKGDVLYLPAAGFGELIITPIYEVLKRRGVKFKFFHRITSIEPAGTRIARVVMSKQVELNVAEYSPLVPITGQATMRGWHTDPDWAQIVGGEPTPVPDYESYWEPASVGSVTLLAGTDYDTVVLAIPVNALRELAAPLVAADPRWGDMIASMPGVPNVAMQLWMDKTVQELGWARAPALDAGPVPFDVWTDMSDSLEYENWPPGDKPLSVHYLCGVLATELHTRDASRTDTPSDARAMGRNRAIAFLETDAYAIWPSLYAPGRVFRWDSLHAPVAMREQTRIDAQYVRVNVDPSEVTHGSPPGSTSRRFYAGACGFDNMVCAGDWVRNGLNSAAVEAAFMGGRQAARAIYGGTEEIPGEFWLSKPPPHLAAVSAAPTSGPEYISRIGRGEQAMPFPGVMNDADMTVFVLKGDKAASQALVDRYLNGPCRTPGKYEVDTDAVLVSFMDAKMTSGGASVGWLPDKECAIWIGLKSGGRRLFWMPYIVVDTSIAMVTGREIWGFAKELGRMQLSPTSWTAFATTFDPLDTTTEGAEGAVVVAREVAPAGLIGGIVHTLTGFLGAAAGHLVDELFGVPEPLVVNLKQLRDATVPGKACYQSIVESRFRIDDFKTASVLTGTYEVRFPPHASHTIASDLGLHRVNTPSAVFTLKMDFTALPGTEVWRSP